MSDFDAIFNAKNDKPKKSKSSKQQPKAKPTTNRRGMHVKRPGKSSAPGFKGQVFYVPLELIEQIEDFAKALTKANGDYRIDGSDIALVAIKEYLSILEPTALVATNIVETVDGLIIQ